MFAGLLRMNDRCPQCGLRFEREHGYFTGAMIVSYMLAIPALALLSIAVLWATRWRVEWALLAADVLFLAFVPLIFRYSRILWMYFDRAVDPDGNN